ncbi:MAG TPA: kelch repeat-containing protein, partial [Pyrinomonadaceae bacterium]|nr:kelch repeat-containing protein [Pyrinomonadaceae bacterium]
MGSVKKAVSYGLLTALMIPMLIFGQSIRKPVSNDSSLADAGNTAPIKGEKQESPIVSTDIPNQIAPEGTDPCGWTASTVSPLPILDQGTVTIGSNLYTFAGVSTAIIATANKFDGTTWSSIAPVPVALEFPTVVSDGTSAYIMGGADGTGSSVSTLYRYNTATNDYTTLATSAAGTSTWNAAGAYLNGKVYKIGGYHSAGGTTTGLATVEIYDIASNTWSTGASYPLAQGWESAFVQGNFIYVAGGLDAAAGSVPSTKTYRYDPGTNTWDDAAIADLPLSRWGAASSQTVYNGGWVLAGGYVNGTAASNLSNGVVKWDPVTNTWADLPNMLQARSRMTGSVLNGAFHVIGGRSSAGGFAGTNDNQRLFCIDQNLPFLQGSVAYVSDNGTPANNVPDPGETVTVSLDVHNIGGASTSSVNVSLLSTGGITNPSGTQSYGVIAPGATVTHNFTFQVPANAPCGSQITLTFDIVDGATHYTVTKTYNLGVLQTSLSENFDTATTPNLPAGWTQVQTSGAEIVWATVSTSSNSSPNSAFAPDPAAVNAGALVSPAFNVTTPTAAVTFKNFYNTENTFDGMVLEISIAGGAFQDIVAAGGSFSAGGYTGPISTAFSSPIAGRQAWSGNAGGYITSTANLPPSANGQSV